MGKCKNHYKLMEIIKTKIIFRMDIIKYLKMENKIQICNYYCRNQKGQQQLEEKLL